MILCITHSRDFYNINLFFEYLTSKNIPYFRLNSDKLNHAQKISISQNSFELTDESGNLLKSEDITAVWHRKSWRIDIPDELDEEYGKIFVQEYSTLRYNLFTALQHVPWINPFEIENKIDGNKMLQLSIAEKNGLVVPETLFSNNGEAVTSFFYNHCNGKAARSYFKINGRRKFSFHQYY